MLRLVSSLQQRFCKVIIPNVSLFTLTDVAQPVSLSEHCTDQLTQNISICKILNRIRIVLEDSLNYVVRAQSQLKSKFATPEVNLQCYLLNVQSLLHKMLDNPLQLSDTLKKLFLLHASYFNFDDPNSFKHFHNYFLSLLYSKKQQAFGLLKYMKSQEVPQAFKNRLFFLQGILQSVANNTSNALASIQQFKPETQEDKGIFMNNAVMLNNNKAWIKLWSKDDATKQDYLKAAQEVIQSLKIAQLQDTKNYLKQRSDLEELTLKFILEKKTNFKMKKSEGIQLLTLIHKHSHITSMNIGELLYLAGRQQESTVYLQLSSKTGVSFQQFNRITRGLVYTANIFVKNRLDQQAQNMYLGILKQFRMLPQHSLKFLLYNYAQFLQIRKRYYQAQQYFQQIANMGDFEEQQKLDRLLLHDYNFNY